MANQSFPRICCSLFSALIRFIGSKRNQYKISRGALGDALKEVSCIPYALAREHQQQQQQQQQNPMEWNEPLIITTKVKGVNQRFLVNLVINRINQTISSHITESDKEGEEEEEKRTQQQKKELTNCTTAREVRLPIVGHLLDLAKLKRFLIQYAVFNTHIGFTFNLPVDLSTKANEQNEITTLNFPQLQPINSKWTNK